MGVKVCGQTLILVDNDGTLTEVNQKIIKSTLKYMIYHAPENRAFCISTYTHELEMEEVYTQDTNDLLCKVDLMEFGTKDSNLVDVLSKVYTQWKDSDFACRDIVVFTDGLEGVNTEYEEEELYFLINNTEYPVYIVDLVQENNAMAKKQLSAISTLSNGKLFMSEYPGDDAGVDKHLTEEIYRQMDIYASREWKEYEDRANGIDESEEEESSEETEDANTKVDENCKEALEESLEKDVVSNECVEEDMAYSDGAPLESEVLYESRHQEAYIDNPKVLAMGLFVLLIIILVGFAASMFVIKNKRRDAKEEKELMDKTNENVTKVPLFSDDDMYFDDFLMSDINETRILKEDDNEATRLLVTNNTHDLELEDIENSSNIRRIPIDGRIIVGRKSSEADVVINDETVSKRHCAFSYSCGKYYVEDLSSSNGTIVNGQKITKKELHANDRIKIGNSTYIVRIGDEIYG